MIVIGYFGYVSEQIDGQTIKTRNIYSILCESHDVTYFDTEVLKRNKFQIFNLVIKVLRNKNIFYLPGQNNLKYFSPFIFLIGILFQKSINYIVVGGWLYDFLKSEHKFYTFFLKGINSILVETNYLLLNLNNEGFANVSIIPNFRNVDTTNIKVRINTSGTLKIVFMARVMKEKGIFLLLEFMEMYNSNIDLFNKKIELSIYGPVSLVDKQLFFRMVDGIDCVRYLGVLRPEDVYETLNSYDILVLPTYYEGEGFPGTIIDAYLSAIPVISTRWKQIPEFIDNGTTGYIIENDCDELYRTIQMVCNSDELLINLKHNALLKSKEYSKSKSKLILESKIL